MNDLERVQIGLSKLNMDDEKREKALQNIEKWRQKTSGIDAKTGQKPSKIPSRTAPERLPKGCRKQARKRIPWY